MKKLSVQKDKVFVNGHQASGTTRLLARITRQLLLADRRPVSVETLLRRAWGYGPEEIRHALSGRSTTVRVNIWKLRRLLGYPDSKRIVAVTGKGYKLVRQ